MPSSSSLHVRQPEQLQPALVVAPGDEDRSCPPRALLRQGRAGADLAAGVDVDTARSGPACIPAGRGHAVEDTFADGVFVGSCALRRRKASERISALSIAGRVGSVRFGANRSGTGRPSTAVVGQPTRTRAAGCHGLAGASVSRRLGLLALWARPSRSGRRRGREPSVAGAGRGGRSGTGDGPLRRPADATPAAPGAVAAGTDARLPPLAGRFAAADPPPPGMSAPAFVSPRRRLPERG